MNYYLYQFKYQRWHEKIKQTMREISGLEKSYSEKKGAGGEIFPGWGLSNGQETISCSTIPEYKDIKFASCFEDSITWFHNLTKTTQSKNTFVSGYQCKILNTILAKINPEYI